MEDHAVIPHAAPAKDAETINRIEYRIRKVTRYILTRYEETTNGGGVQQIGGEYDNPQMAYEIGYAMAKLDHDRQGWPVGDDRIKYPEDPRAADAVPVKD